MKDGSFQVSVVTPVYNAETTIARAVDSAASLDEVGEIILVDDSGPDNSFHLCVELEKKHRTVRLIRHPDRRNHGAGASRNLGIRNARYPFIAFLDADDYYLPNRFSRDRQILSSDGKIDGVYGATGIDYKDETSRQRFHEAGYSYQEFTSLSGPVSPEELFAVLFHQHSEVKGEFTTAAITVRKKLIERVGGFHADLRLQQDTHLWKRLAAYGRLAPGILDHPIAVRGVHEHNRMTDQSEQARFRELWWDSLHHEFRKEPLTPDKQAIFRKAYTRQLALRGLRGPALRSLFQCLLTEPSLLTQSYGFFDQTVSKIFNNQGFVRTLLSAKRRLSAISPN